MTLEAYPIHDTLAGARGASASLAQIAGAITEASAEPMPTPAALRQVAQTIPAQAQRAALGAMSLSAHAGRLDAFAHALALEAEAAEGAASAARAALETEAETDAGNYLREGETQEPAPYAAEAFTAWIGDEGPGAYEPLSEDEARAVYVAAFVRAVGRPSV